MPAPLLPTPFSRIGNALAGVVVLALLGGAIAIRRRPRYGRI